MASFTRFDLAINLRPLINDEQLQSYFFQHSPTPALLADPATLSVLSLNLGAMTLLDYHPERNKDPELTDIISIEQIAALIRIAESSAGELAPIPYQVSGFSGRSLISGVTPHIVLYKEREALLLYLSDINPGNFNAFHPAFSESFLSNLIRDLPGLVYRCRNDRNWTMEFIGGQCRQITGYEPEELLYNRKLSFNDLIKDRYRDGLWEKWQEIIRRRETFIGEYEITTSDGSTRWVWEKGIPVFDSDGNVLALEGIIFDVSDRIHAEKALHDSEERLLSLINAMPDIVCFKDGEGRWILANDFDVKLFDLEGVDYRGKKDSELAAYSPFYSDAFMICEATDEAAWNHKGPSRNDEIIIRSDGKISIFDIIKVPSFNPDGSRKALIVVGRDITERTLAVKSMQQEHEFSQSIIDTAQVVILVLDTEGGIVHFNPYMEELSGYRLKDVLGKNVFETMMPEKDRKRLKLLFNRPLNNKKRCRGNGKLLLNDQRILEIEWSIKSLCDIDGNVVGMLAIGQDITERVQAQKKIISLNEDLEKKIEERTFQLEATNKELEAFAYSVSHDLRAPLRAIDGFSKILTDDYAPKLDEEGKRMLGTIRGNTRKMDKLITNILSLSKLSMSEMKLESVNMEQMVEEVFREIAADADPRNLELQLNPLPEALADAVLIRQVWHNLISNAIKFTSTRNHRVVEIGCNFCEDCATYYVKDNGVGFNPEYSHRLFGVFQRLHPMEDFEGTGVGLAIVQRIIHRHGGKVSASSELDKGAVFTFTLP